MAFRPIQIDTKLFLGKSDLDRSRLATTALMHGLALVNRIWLLYYPDTPLLYDTHVLYQAEVNTERWADIPTILERGYGDCEDLACWRIAELWANGVHAMPFITWRPRADARGTIYHALVRWPDGRIEDPSRALGMRHAVTRAPVFLDKNLEA